jgi:hypothetical protein
MLTETEKPLTVFVITTSCSQIICVKALRKLIFFCYSAGWGTVHADTHFIVAGDRIFYKSLLCNAQFCIVDSDV